jgi:hypothetical protein
MSNTAQRQSRGRELHRGQDRTEAISGNVVRSAARRQSMLCRSTTYRAHQARDPSRDSDGHGVPPTGWTSGREVGNGAASAAADRSAQFTVPSRQRKLAHGDPGSGAGPFCPSTPRICARARRGVPGVGRRVLRYELCENCLDCKVCTNLTTDQSSRN